MPNPFVNEKMFKNGNNNFVAPTNIDDNVYK